MNGLMTCLLGLALAAPARPKAPMGQLDRAQLVQLLNQAGLKATDNGPGKAVSVEISASGKKHKVWVCPFPSRIYAECFLADPFGKPAPEAVEDRARDVNPTIRPYSFNVSGTLISIKAEMPNAGITPAKLKQLLDGMVRQIEKHEDIWGRARWPKK